MPSSMKPEQEIYIQKGDYIIGDRYTRLNNLKNGSLFKIDPLYGDIIAKTKKALTELAIRLTIRGNKLPPSSDDQEETSLPNLTNQKRQAMSLMCRIYIGSINFTVTEEMIRNAFTSFGPVKNVNMSLDLTTNRHKGYAFLEFETPEAAYLALSQMDGVLLGGRPIKVGRPSNMPQADPLIKQLIEEAKKFPRIYISSIHPNLTEEEISSLFEPFGEIKGIQMPTNVNRQSAHLGYCYIEYGSMADAEVAVNSMNLFQLMNLTLRVGKSVTPPFNEMNNKEEEERKNEASQMAKLINNKLSHTNPSDVGMKLEYSDTCLSRSKNSPNSRHRSKERSSRHSSRYDRDDRSRHRDERKEHSRHKERSRDKSERHSRSIQRNDEEISKNDEQYKEISSNNDIFASKSDNSNSPTTNSPIELVNKSYSKRKESHADKESDNQVKNMMDLSPEPKKHKSDSKAITKSKSPSKKPAEPSQDSENQLLKAEESYTISGSEARQMHMHKLLRPKEQRAVVLSNLISYEELDDENKDDIRQECERICLIDNFTVYVQEENIQPDCDESNEKLSKTVHFFVNCTNSEEASKLIEKMNGRYFSQRIIKAKLYDQDLYEQDYFRVYD